MAGQNADMTLKVGLDLNFFKQELQKASSSLAGQPIDINIRFNKKGIADQYRLLTRYLGGKKSFDVKIESNTLNALTDKVANFQKTLKALKDEKVELSINASANIEKFSKEKIRKIRAQIRRDIVSGGAGEIQLPTKLATPNVAAFIKALAKQAQVTVSIKNGVTGKEARNVLDAIESRIQSDQKIKQGGGKLRVPTSIKASINNADVSDFKKAVNEKLGSIAIKIKAEVDIAKTPAQIQAEVARKMEDIARIGAERMAGGGVTETARREQFRTAITGGGIGSLKNIAKQIGVSGYSKYKSDTAAELINKLVQEASIEAITKYLDPQAVMRNPDRSGLNKALDTFARGLFYMLGMDPATIRREMQQRRALPGVNFSSTVPPRNIPIGPSGTGRALPPGAIPSALPGTAFASQKYLPTGLSDEMQRIMRSAAYAFVDSVKQQIRSVRIGLGASQQPLLGASRVAGLLPAGVGRAPSVYSTGAIGGETRVEMMARREREARMRSDLRGMDVMGGGAGRPPSPYSYAYRGARPTSSIVPYAAGGAIVPQPSMARGGGGGMQPPGGGGGGGMGRFGGLGRALGGVPNLPGAGTIRELGSEFGFATKQVLLFGQAYKLLAFIQDFPAQVSNAVSQLQSFRNTLLSVTGSAEAAADANEFILAAVEKYSIPLQSARDGFAKLFASMEPAGFAAGEIQNLFLGISKAAATYGLSADKVDRVNYAFAQMASKGQVMSEELKGQLGDVLPGAMGIFAKAAGFEGPDAIQKFGKALEDGEYKGGKMRELLRNVANEMNKEFGPGAEGAARTFQGAINRMQTATAKLYESFEPAAIGIMNAVMVPFVQTLKTATDGINSYFSGQAAATPAAQDFANVLKTLVPTLTGIGENLKYVFQQVAVLIQGFGAFALQVGRLLALPIVRYLAGAYVQTLLLTTAFKALATSGLGAALVAIGRFIAQGVVYAQVTLGMRVATQQTTVAMYQFGTAVQTVMIKSIIGIALVAISSFIARIVELRGQLAAISGDAKSMEDLAKSSAKLGDVGATKEAVGNIKNRTESYKELREQIQAAKKAEGMKGEGATAGMTKDIKLTTALGNKMVELGLINKRVLQTSSNGYKVNELALDGVLTKINENITSFDKAGQKGEQYIQQAIKQNQKLKEQGGLGLDGPDGKTAENASKEAEKLANQQQQAAIDAANSQNALNKTIMEGRMSLDDQAFQHQLALIDARNSYELAGLNSIQARQEKFQQDLQKLELDRISIIRKAEQDAVKAVADYRAAESTAAATGGATGLFQGSTGVSSGPHFDVRRANGGAISETEARALFSEEVRRTLTMTSPYGPRVAPVPGASTFHRGVDLAGPANTPLNLAPGYSLQGVAQEGGLGYTARVSGPTGEMYKVGHMQPPGASYTRQRRSDKATGKLQVEQTQMATQQEMAARTAIMATNEALEKRSALIKANINTIFPVAEQKLENDLMKIRNDLQLQGMPQEYIKYQEDLVKANYEMEERIKRNKEETEDYEKALAALQKKQKDGAALTPNETAALKANTEAIAQNKQELQDLTEAQKAYQIAALENAIATMKQADALKALEETSGRINQAVEGVTGTYKDMFKEIAKGGDSVDALKKAQEALADQALTMFFDFAMQPVEKFFKDQLGAILGVPNEEEQRKASIKKMEEQLARLREIEAATKQTAANTGAPAPGAPAPDNKQQSMSYASTAPAYGGVLATPFSESTSSLTESANAYSEQLGKVDASVWGSAATLGQASEEMGPNGAAGKSWQESLGKVVGGLGMAAGSVMGIVAGINQIKEGGTSNVLGGIGMIASMAGSLLGGFSGFFGGGSAGMFGTSSSFNGTADALAKAPFAPKLGPVFANGGIAPGGFRAFANGGVVSGPTLGLVGEGRYNEAVVPLPDGKSIPVQLAGGRSARDIMGDNRPGSPPGTMLSMSFETTKINGVEYVSREQLEQAMAETRRASITGGAQRGMSMTLDKIQQNPSVRSRIGLR
jgi:tape measure domain-containing protein